MNGNKNIPDKTTVNGSRIYIDNGEVKTILGEEIQQSGYMSVDELYNLVDAEIRMIYGLNNGN